MIFVINNLKYNTDNMELISDKCKYTFDALIFDVSIKYYGKNVKLWKSKKDNWLLTYDRDVCTCCGIALSSKNASELLLKYDITAYEKIFGEFEEA